MSEDRAGLTFKADVRDEAARKKIMELMRLGDNVNAQVREVDALAVTSYQNNLALAHDIMMISRSLGEMMGIQLAGWQRLALSMIEQTLLAGMHSLAMIEASMPWMVPIIIRSQALLMTLQVVAYADVQARGEQAQDEWFRTQQAMQTVIRFMG